VYLVPRERGRGNKLSYLQENEGSVCAKAICVECDIKVSLPPPFSFRKGPARLCHLVILVRSSSRGASARGRATRSTIGSSRSGSAS